MNNDMKDNDINDKKLKLDKIITLNNDLKVGEIIEYNLDNYSEEYGKILFLIYISSETLIDDNGNALPILGEEDLPTLYLLLIHDTGIITRNYNMTAKGLYLHPDIFKRTNTLIQYNPQTFENHQGIVKPVPENERSRIISLIEEVKGKQKPISESQKLPEGGRKKKSTFRKVSTFRKGGAKKSTFRKGRAKKSTFRKGRKSTFRKGGAKH